MAAAAPVPSTSAIAVAVRPTLSESQRELRASRSKLDDVAVAQHALLHALSGEQRADRRAAVLEEERAVSLDHAGVAQRGPGHHDLETGLGADGGGRARQDVRLPAARAREMDEAGCAQPYLLFAGAAAAFLMSAAAAPASASVSNPTTAE